LVQIQRAKWFAKVSTATAVVDDDALEISKTLWARGGKRAADLVVASVLTVAFSPLMAVLALLIRWTSAGPVLFVQQRAGRGGRLFRVYKFRTMRGDRTPDAEEIVPLDHADITRLGRLIRRFKVDELPQLVNVLVGDMALVGPRPTLPDQVRRYDEFQRRRLCVRPGLTGLAQVNGNAAIPWEQRILYDVAYVKQCGFWVDVGILVKTLMVIALGEDRFARRFEEKGSEKGSG